MSSLEKEMLGPSTERELQKRPAPEQLRLSRVRIPVWAKITAGTLLCILAPPALGALGAPSWVAGIMVAGTAVVAGAGTAIARDRFLHTLRPLLIEVSEGRIDEAASGFAALAQRETNQSRRSLYVAMIGSLEKRRQRFDLAIPLLAEAERGSGVLTVRSIARAERAESQALDGDLASARELLAQDKSVRKHAPAATSVVWCMAGLFDEVLGLENAPVARRVREYVGHEHRVLALMKAYASQTTRPSVAGYHLDARPAFRGEYKYLSDNWPALRKYLDEHPWEDTPSLPARLPAARLHRARSPWPGSAERPDRG